MPSIQYFTISTRVPVREAMAFKNAAERNCTSVSKWIRNLVIKDVRPDDYVEEIQLTETTTDEEPSNEPQATASESDAVYDEDGAATSEMGLACGQASEAVDSQETGEGNASGRSALREYHEAIQRQMAEPAASRPAKQSLTYRRDYLCNYCRRIGPSCPECRQKTRNRVPE